MIFKFSGKGGKVFIEEQPLKIALGSLLNPFGKAVIVSREVHPSKESSPKVNPSGKAGIVTREEQRPKACHPDLVNP